MKIKKSLYFMLFLLSISNISKATIETVEIEALKKEVETLKKRLEIFNPEDKNVGKYSIIIGKEVGENTDISNDNNIFHGYRAGKGSSKVHNAIYIGNQAGIEVTNSDHNIGIGFKSSEKTSGLNNVSIGIYSGRGIEGHGNVSIGASTNGFNNSKKKISNSVAIGNQAKNEGDFSVAIGGASSSKDRATAVGGGARALSNKSLALGLNAVVNENNESGIALGASSLSDRSSNVFGYDPSGEYSDLEKYLGDNKEKYNSLIAEYGIKIEELEALKKEESDIYNDYISEQDKEIKETKKTKWFSKQKERVKKQEEISAIVVSKNKLINKWNSTSGAVSIGNETSGITRQITGLAAGSEDTDAVNVAQLKNIALKFETNNGEGKVKLSEGKLGIIGKDGIVTEIDEEGKIIIKLDEKQSDTKNIETNSYSGTALAIAMANMPNVVGDGIGITSGFGTYMGESSVAIGLNGNSKGFMYKASGALTTKGKVGFGFGFGYKFASDKDAEKKELEKDIKILNEKIEILMNEINDLKNK